MPMSLDGPVSRCPEHGEFSLHTGCLKCPGGWPPSHGADHPSEADTVPGHDVTDVELGNRILERAGEPVAPHRKALAWLDAHQHLPALLASIYLDAGPLATVLLHEMAMELVRAQPTT